MKKTFAVLVLIFLTNMVGMIYNMYLTWWFDAGMHFLGGFFMAVFMWQYLGDSLPKDKFKKALALVGVVSFIGVVWEFAEYIASLTLIEPIYNNFGIRTYFIGGLDDTMSDLLMDILGAFTFVLALKRKKT